MESELGQDAHLVMLTLRDHPHLTTPGAISMRGPMIPQQMETPDVVSALHELATAGIAEERDGHWRLLKYLPD